jgi:GT2 family glycosyltransferase
MSGPPLLFSVAIPSRRGGASLLALLGALAAQTLPHERFEVLVALDDVSAPSDLAARVSALGGRLLPREGRGGPGQARNLAARAARGAYLAFTEDDVTPRPDWLARAAARLDAHPEIDVLEGETRKPGGRTVRLRPTDSPQFLPTNLFVRRELFHRVGGYCEDYFDRERGIYFREDSDLGFSLEAAGARIEREPAAIVVHPEEHAGFLDPLRWARRYEMDPLLAARHPERFRERIEVYRLGPLVVRRIVVRASVVYVAALAVALAAWALRMPELAGGALIVAALALLVVWAKWRLDPRRLPLVPFVPFALLLALARGRSRARRLMREAA